MYRDYPVPQYRRRCEQERYRLYKKYKLREYHMEAITITPVQMNEAHQSSRAILDALQAHISEAQREGNHAWEHTLRVFLDGVEKSNGPFTNGMLRISLNLGVA
jgi:hypothetical protein